LSKKHLFKLKTLINRLLKTINEIIFRVIGTKNYRSFSRNMKHFYTSNLMYSVISVSLMSYCIKSGYEHYFTNLPADFSMLDFEEKTSIMGIDWEEVKVVAFVTLWMAALISLGIVIGYSGAPTATPPIDG
jgi:hypothetical protein